MHVPSALLDEHLDFILKRKINPEVAFSGDSLDTMDWGRLREIAAVLAENDIRTTIHAPFMDLSPGALDRLVREATRHRFRQVMDAAEILRPSVVVFHPGYDRWRFGGSRERWLRTASKPSARSWKALQIGCVVAVENIFEEEPSTLRALLDAFDSPFSATVSTWVTGTSSRNSAWRNGSRSWAPLLPKHISTTITAGLTTIALSARPA